jgi:hypothetical protein
MRCLTGAILALTMMMGACGSGSSTQVATGAARTSTPSISSPPPEPILGTWRMEYTCDKFVRAFKDTGIGDLAARWLVGFGIQQGRVDQVANGMDQCEGAKRFQRTQIFHPNGYLLRYQNEKLVDDCRCYELIDGHTLVVLGDPGDPDISLSYRIDDGTLTFQAAIPDQCSSAKCEDQFAFAVGQYALGPWHRVDS